MGDGFLPRPEGIGSVVDLTGSDEDFEFQSFALSRARFNVVTGHGAAALSSAFRVPTVATNCYARSATFNDADLVLLKRVCLDEVGEVDLGGEDHRIDGWPDIDLRAIAASDDRRIGGYTLHGFAPNTSDQVAGAVEEMLVRTQDTGGWRDEAAQPSMPALEKLAWPLDMGRPRSRIWRPPA